MRDTQRFVDAVHVAASEAAAGSLVCLGVRPNRPATGFGYLRCARRPVRGRAVDVSRFVEKPDLRKARRFLKDGAYLWNAGMFVWRVESFLAEMARTAPAMETAVRAFAAGRSRMWTRAPRISVDYAVMERARMCASSRSTRAGTTSDRGTRRPSCWNRPGSLRPTRS